MTPQKRPRTLESPASRNHRCDRDEIYYHYPAGDEFWRKDKTDVRHEIIANRLIVTLPIKKAGHGHAIARTGAFTLAQCIDGISIHLEVKALKVA